ncbi:MAG: hypothetical protein IPN90_10560 [Elusimicrobia bacterium]|nr:hypothetical protein [Elusimicrobiota bacterium]
MLDLIFLAGVGFQLWTRYHTLQRENLPVLSENDTIEPAVVMEQAPVADPIKKAIPPPSDVKPKMGRTFLFISGTAKSVQLVGDFNGWSPQAFKKDEKGRWTVSVMLAPGDYSYNFIVDGKTIRDPNQRRTDLEERSLLTVSP